MGEPKPYPGSRLPMTYRELFKQTLDQRGRPVASLQLNGGRSNA